MTSSERNIRLLEYTNGLIRLSKNKETAEKRAMIDEATLLTLRDISSSLAIIADAITLMYNEEENDEL